MFPLIFIEVILYGSILISQTTNFHSSISNIFGPLSAISDSSSSTSPTEIQYVITKALSPSTNVPSPSITESVIISPTPSTQDVSNSIIVPPITTNQDTKNPNTEKSVSIDSNKIVTSTPNTTPVVCVDAGHGGSQTGTVYEGIYEKNVNLNIALRLGKNLERNGLHVVYTRKSDISMDLISRAELANKSNADLFISVHNNALPSNFSHRGTETLYTLADAPNTSKSNLYDEVFARTVQSELCSSLKSIDQGIKFRPKLAVLRRTHMPAVIAEIAYMSNKNDLSLLRKDSYIQNAANALSSATLKTLKKMGRLN